jgi:beta-glucosidase
VFRPDQELRGFAKVHLEAGASARVEVPLDRRAFATWDTASGDWLVEGGAFEIRVGRSSRDIRAAATIEIPGDPGGVPQPEAPAVATAYRDPRPGMVFERPAFEALLGRALPPNVPVPQGAYTMNTPLADMRTPVARFLHTMMQRQAVAFVGGDPDSPLGRIVAASIANGTLRVLRMVGGDLLDERMLAGLVALANARYGLGARTLLRGGLAMVRTRVREGR